MQSICEAGELPLRDTQNSCIGGWHFVLVQRGPMKLWQKGRDQTERQFNVVTDTAFEPKQVWTSKFSKPVADDMNESIPGKDQKGFTWISDFTTSQSL
ncbi:hypothetical protein [uncultured Roseobacter sp.]|uniref:hypothetical protein n=1 Tax=uncultured Roseobacter sp. TaxID=114847 RepID=UPI00262DBF37|nr:hypothetical protein [uncultured Roseobacter sp.]